MAKRLFRWMVVLVGVIALLAACVPGSAIPTPAILPTPSRTVVPTADFPTPTTVILTRPPVTLTPTRFTSTPRPSLTPTSVNLAISNILSAADTLLLPAHDLCIPQVAIITATLRANAPLEWVALSWSYRGQAASRRIAMQRVAQAEPNDSMVASDWQGQLGPFYRTGTVVYQVAAQNVNGELVVSGERALEVSTCLVAPATPTATPGATPTNTPYIGEAASVHAHDASYDVTQGRTLSLTLTWNGGLPPYQVEVYQPQRGTVTGVRPNVIYIPPDDFTGQDRFSFRVTDSSGQASLGTITLRVSRP